VRAIHGVRADLARDAEFEALARAGAERARDLAGQQGLPAAGMFNPKYSVARAISNRLAGNVEGRSLDRLAEVMLDPALAARVMETTRPPSSPWIAEQTARYLINQGAIGAPTVMIAR
jgi:hypothetical protein